MVIDNFKIFFLNPVIEFNRVIVTGAAQLNTDPSISGECSFMFTVINQKPLRVGVTSRT